MAEYDPRQELMATQQSLLKEHEHQLGHEIEKNVPILNHLLQYEKEGEKMPLGEMQKTLACEK